MLNNSENPNQNQKSNSSLEDGMHNLPRRGRPSFGRKIPAVISSAYSRRSTRSLLILLICRKEEYNIVSIQKGNTVIFILKVINRFIILYIIVKG